MSANLGNAQLVRAKLEEAIERGRSVGERVIPQILTEVPQDEIQPAKQTGLVVSPGAAMYRTRIGTSRLTDYAFRQLCERAGGSKFATFAAELLERSKAPARDGKRLAAGELQGEAEDENPNAWRAELLQEIGGRLLERSEDRYLIRRINGEVRGVLSDQFRRLDCRPMLDAFLKAAKKWKAVAAGGHVTETRAVVRVLVPQVYEPRPGEAVVYGLQFSNSDFGAGMYQVSDFVLRLLCTNGMTGEQQLKQIHLGRRISDDFEMSERTHRLDSETLVSATIDTVGYLLSDVVLDRRTREIGALSAKELTFEQASRAVGKRLSKAETDAARDLYEGPDVLNMPAGNDMWRFANALSFLANDEKKIENEDRRIELQEIAGKLLPPIPKRPTRR